MRKMPSSPQGNLLTGESQKGFEKRVSNTRGNRPYSRKLYEELSRTDTVPNPGKAEAGSRQYGTEGRKKLKGATSGKGGNVGSGVNPKRRRRKQKGGKKPSTYLDTALTRKQMEDRKRMQKKAKGAFFQQLPDKTPEEAKVARRYPGGAPYDDDGRSGKEPKNKKSKTMNHSKKKMKGGGLKGAVARTKRMQKRSMGMGGDYMSPDKEVKFGGPTKKMMGGKKKMQGGGQYDSMSFNSAFGKARAALGPGKTFMWRGKKYTTNRADDKPATATNKGKATKADTSGGSTMDKVAKGDTSGATKVTPSAKEGAKKRDAKRAGRQEARATRKADRKSGAAKVSRMESRNVKKVGRIQSRASAKATREEKRMARKEPRKAKRAAVKGARAQMKENIKAARGKQMGGMLAGAIGGAKDAEGGFGKKLMGAAKGALGGGLLGRGIGAVKGAMGGGGLKGAMQGAAGGAFGNSNPMGQQEEQMMYGGKRKMKKGGKKMMYGGMKDRRKKSKRGGKR